MKVSTAQSAPRIEQDQFNRSLRIKNYGKGNNYPQKIIDIVGSSGTGKVCFNIYHKFIEGGGFEDQSLATLVINEKDETANHLLRKIAKDIRYFDGCAVLVKYNGMGEQVELYNIPFEQCRLEIDEEKNLNGKIAIHPDWGGYSGKRIMESNIERFHRYNPETVREEMKVTEGGAQNYKGQIYYFTTDGEFEYPVCPFDPIITDMLTEDSVATVKHRNAKYNFLPSGILVRKGIKPATDADGYVDTEAEESNSASADEIKRMQGDMNTSKIWVVDVEFDEEKPEFIPFEAKNYDRQYELTERTVQENIGRMNMVPPILRGVDIGAGFGADLMENAYDFMNSVTGNERRMISEFFVKLFENASNQFKTDILPLEYISKSKTPKTNEPVS